MYKFSFLYIVIFSLLIIYNNANGQINRPDDPEFHNPKPINTNPNIPLGGNSVNHNQSIVNTNYTQKTSLEITSNADLNEQSYYTTRALSYKLPSLQKFQGTEAYYKAEKIINDMLSGQSPLDLKKAVFTVENAFFNNTLSYGRFNEEINKMVRFCQVYMAQEGYSLKSNMSKVMTVFKYFADTMSIKLPSMENNQVHYPLKYDFDDYLGEKDWSKMFVSKLVVEGSGQCHSMPLLFLILAQELGAKVYLSLSPNHSYIKFQDDNGIWYNIETTNGRLTSDSWVSGSGYVKSEAIKNGLYMDTLSQEQTIAFCMSDLVEGYKMKYGYDEFTLRNTNRALEKYPNNVKALCLKLEYYNVLFDYTLWQLGYPKYKPDISKYPKIIDVYKKGEEIYTNIDQLGYQEMPQEAYENWLKSLEQEKFKQEHQKKFINLKNSIK